MRQLVERAFGNPISADNRASVRCRIDGDNDDPAFAGRMDRRGIVAAARAPAVSFIVAFVALAWASPAMASADTLCPQICGCGDTQRINGDVGVRSAGACASEPALAGRFAGNPSRRLAQATQGVPGDLQKTDDRQPPSTDLLAQKLSIMRRVEMLLTLQQARAEAARFNQSATGEHAESRKDQQQKNDQLRQEAESGAVELCRALLPTNRADQPERLVAELQSSLQRERSRAASLAETAAKCDTAMQASRAVKTDQAAPQASGATELNELKKSLQQQGERAAGLEKDLAAARHDLDAQTALAARASEDARQAKAAAEADAVELKKSLQQERERATGLEKDLAAARHDLDAQTALAARASEDARQAKAAAEADAVELKKSLQQERERAAGLEKDLAAARHDLDAQTALAARAGEDARQAKAAAEAGVVEQKKSLMEAQEHSVQLEKDAAAARRELEAQTALASEANEKASRSNDATDRMTAELKVSLQKEHARAETLAADLSAARAAILAHEAEARKATEVRQTRESEAAALQKVLKQEQERSERLQRDLVAARSDVEAQASLTKTANENVAALKETVDKGSATFEDALQTEHNRAETLSRDLSMLHTAIYTYEVQARMACVQAVSRPAANSTTELAKSRQQDQAAMQRDLEMRIAAARASAETARLKKRATDDRAAELQKSLQQERDRTAGLEHEPAAERTSNVSARDAGSAAPVVRGQAVTAAVSGNNEPDPANAAAAARMVARASMLLGQGDIGSARIVLERAAETGSAQASFALAETYDPLVLRKWGALGTLGDSAKARELYTRAQAAGIEEAKERVEALSR